MSDLRTLQSIRSATCSKSCSNRHTGRRAHLELVSGGVFERRGFLSARPSRAAGGGGGRGRLDGALSRLRRQPTELLRLLPVGERLEAGRLVGLHHRLHLLDGGAVQRHVCGQRAGKGSGGESEVLLEVGDKISSGYTCLAVA